MNRIRPVLWFIFALVALVGRSLQAADQPLMPEGSPVPLTSLQEGTTVPAPVIEPFVSPFGSRRAKIVSGFGIREVPGVAGKSEMHEGIDYSVTQGASVRAARSGKVLFAGFSNAYASRTDKTDKHRLVILRHTDGMSSRYVHLNSLLVRPMQSVSTTTILGTAAESDEWTEPVVHFEIRNAAGQAVDPEEILAPSVK